MVIQEYVFFIAFGFHGDLGGFISRALCLLPELPDTVEPVHVTRVFYVENKNMTKKSSLLSLNFEFCRQLITLFFVYFTKVSMVFIKQSY